MLDGRRKKQIKNIADQILASFGSAADRTDIEDLISKHEISVVNIPEMNNTISGFSAISQGKQVIGILETERSSPRGRFTLGHELGHLTLHQNSLVNYGPAEVFFRRKDGHGKFDIKEIEANYFSACILMPEEKVQNAVNNLSAEKHLVSKLAEHFDVSEPAMTVRLMDLGYGLF